jgi:hypothetical protein
MFGCCCNVQQVVFLFEVIFLSVGDVLFVVVAVAVVSMG